MLLELRLQSLATVDSLTWQPGPGLNVVTGESGAGKSVLVGAVALLLGAKAGAEAVRTGAAAALVEGRMDLSGSASLTRDLEALGVTDPSDVVWTRELSAEGRSRFRLNGRALSAQQVREFGARVMDLHGQQDHQGLLRPDVQRELLDRFGGHLELAQAEEAAYVSLEQSRESLRSFEATVGEAAAQRDFWAFQLQELDAASFQAGEDELVERERVRLRNAAALGEALRQALDAMSSEGGAADGVASARRWVHKASEWDPALAPLDAELVEVAERARELARELEHQLSGLEADPGRLQFLEERHDLLSRIRRRHGGSLEEAARIREELRVRLEATQDPQAQRERWTAAERVAGQAWWESRGALHQARLRAARSLVRRLRREWEEVGLPGARLEVDLADPPGDRSQPWPHDVEFRVSTNPGEDLRPLAKVASGGEVSRMMLGLRGVLAQVEHTPILLLDEIDAGIGGRLAEVIARKLRALSRSRQVICITHLPGIAAAADHHFAVDKQVQDGRTLTRVQLLERVGRVEEIGRMLAGSRVRENTRVEARELIRHASGKATARGPARQRS